MSNHRKISRIIEPQWVMEGAGVKLRRSIATRELNYVDPFLLFDHFKSDNPDDYLAGFPMHPHRGIETVTYMLEGQVNHKDSISNAGTIQAGDVQWMTSGRGIMHEEMPQPKDGKMDGFQLWISLPARLKMTRRRLLSRSAVLRSRKATLAWMKAISSELSSPVLRSNHPSASTKGDPLSNIPSS